MTKIYSPQKIVSNYVIGIMAGLLLLPGIAMIVFEIYFGLLLVVGWASLLTIYKGIEVDYDNKSIQLFKEYIWIRRYSPINISMYSSYRLKYVSESISFSTRFQSTQFNRELRSMEFYNKRTQIFERIIVADNKSIKNLSVWIEQEFGIPRTIKNVSK